MLNKEEVQILCKIPEKIENEQEIRIYKDFLEEKYLEYFFKNKCNLNFLDFSSNKFR